MYGAITWIFVCATAVSVLVAFGIGAQDVATSFASSVGAKALTMKQAVVLASLCEFGGAVLMGAGVTDTIRTGIADLPAYQSEPDILAYGMLCALTATGIWLIVATTWELPVSTTHSIVGAIIGMTMVSAGPDAVVWSKHKSEFPFFGGVASLVASWVVSPILAGLLSGLIFFLVRSLVLRHDSAYQRAFYVLPATVLLTLFMITIFIIKEPGSNFGWEDTPYSQTLWVAATVGAGAAALAAAWQLVAVKRRVEAGAKEEDERSAAAAAEEEARAMEAGPSTSSGTGADEEALRAAAAVAVGGPENLTPEALQTFRKSRVWAAITQGAHMGASGEAAQPEAQAQEALELHLSEKFDVRAEGVFKYLQVFTACANSFAHGSNDVSNAAGPYAAIYAAWRTSSVAPEELVPTWVLAVGGAGIALGLATYGYRMMQLLGVRMTRMTSSRGFVVELAAACVITIGSRYGLPLSTTHTLVGAVAGVGLLEGRRGFNGMLLLRFFAGWVATLVLAALTAAAFTAQGIYAPSRSMSSQRYAAATYLTSSAWNVATGPYSNDTVLAQIMALPNWNASSGGWKPMLDLNQGVAAQLAALQGVPNIGVCGDSPAGTVAC